MKKNKFLKMAFIVVAGLTSGSLIMPNVAHADSIQLTQEQKDITLKNLNRQISTAQGIQDNCIKLNGFDKCGQNVKYINSLEEKSRIAQNIMIVKGHSDIIVNQCLALSKDPLKECIIDHSIPKSSQLDLG